MKKMPRFRILLFLLVCSVPCFTALHAQSFLFGYPNIGGGGATAGVIGTFTQSSNGQNSNINVCPPPGYSGPLTIQATAVSNSVCTCN